jgi:putative hemolysin
MVEGGHGVPQSVLLWGVVLLTFLAVVSATLSALLERSGPIRLRHWSEEAGGSLRKLFETPARFGIFRYLLSLFSRATPIVLYVDLSALLIGWKREWPGLWALGVVVALVALAEILNRMLVGKDPARALRALTLGYRVTLWLLTPLIAIFAPLVPSSAFERQGHEDGEDSEASDEEIEAFIDVGTREGILEPEEGEWLWGIVGLGDTQARSVMTPRIDMVCAPLDASLDMLADRFIDSGHSRIPVFEDSIDHIVGILHIRDVLRAVRSLDPLNLRELLKPPLFIPETKALSELLRELQARFQQVAIVVDEYGGTAGLVTVEDLLEEIVGEIMDEHEALAAELEPLGDGSFRLDGRARIELLDELFNVEIEDPEYETVAGLIFSELGYVPQVGEQVETHGLRFTVEAVDDRRIQTVRVERINHPGRAEESKEGEA